MRWTDLRAKKRFDSTRQDCGRALGTVKFSRRCALPLSAIVLIWTPVATAQQTPPPAANAKSVAQFATPSIQPALPHPIPPSAAQLRYVALLDPAHGGANTGAILAPSEPEKAYTLSLAIRLHVLLNGRGIPSILTRDSDTTVDNTTRAVTANRAHPAACILIHATATGNGVHLFTSSLQPIRLPDPRRAFLPWQTAQASYITESLRLESDINAAMTRNHVPVLLERTSLVPMDSMACPAVAIEVAPLNAKTLATNAAYQEQIAASLASALAEWRSDWRLQP